MSTITGNHPNPFTEADETLPLRGGQQHHQGFEADTLEQRTTSNQYGTHANHAASDKQVAFLNRLLAERPAYRDVENLFPENVARLDKRQISRKIDEVMQVPVEVHAAAAPGQGPSDKQVAFILKLQGERVCEALDEATVRLLNKRAASAFIDQLMAAPKAKAAPAADGYEPKRGDVHMIGGQYLRVSVGQSSGQAYANRWNADLREWEYEGKGPLRSMTEATRATVEQVKAFGEAYSCCVFCSRDLDTPESVTAGYGPVCARKYDLPWGGKA